MATCVAAFDWARTPLGPIAAWPHSLRTLVDLLLSQPLPMILLWGPDLTQIYNDGWASLAKTKHPAALGQPNHDCWPELRHYNEPIYERVLQGEKVLFHDKLIPLDRSGKGTLEEAYFTVSYSPARDDAGRIAGIFVTVVETTDKVIALRAREERYAVAVDAAELGTFYCEMPLNKIVWNDTCKRHFWLPPDAEVDFNLFYAIIHPEDRERTRQAVERAQHERAPYDVEYRTVSPTGEVRWVRAKGRFFYDTKGEPARFDGITIDVTANRMAEEELRRAKEEAERASRAKDQFLAVLSHELRTPLTPVLTTAQLLERDPSLGAEQREMVHMILRSAELEARLIDDVLDLTRVARGKLELHRTTLDIHAKIANVVNICADDLAAHRIDLRLDLRAERHHANADAARVQQIIWNLLKNAIKFTPPTGRVTITTHNPTPDAVSLTVTDTGIGIDPERIEGLFNAFEQGGRHITRQFGGLGLGLAICKTLVEMHGGTITAASPGRNKGATFTVILQTMDPVAVPDTVLPRAERGRRLRVLLVEDHPDTRRVVAKLLEAFGCRVCTAATVADAKAALDRETPDVLVSDIGLPDGTGLDVIKHARADGRAVPGIALTGYGMEDDVKRSLDAGFAHHLTKPVDVNELEGAISQVAPTIT
ncbi:MAG: ATP-binding protein [Phycisphaerae bacterium]